MPPPPGLQDPTPDGFGPALQPCPLLREKGVTQPLPEPVEPPPKPQKPKKKLHEVEIDAEKWSDEEMEDDDVIGEQVIDDVEAKVRTVRQVDRAALPQCSLI